MTTVSEGVSYRALVSDGRLLTVVMISFVGLLGNNVLAPALPGIGATLDVTEARLGLLVTAYVLPAMVMVPVSGVVADIYGRRVVLLPSLLLFGVAGTLLTLAGSFQTLLILRTVQGIGVAGIMPISVTLLGDLYTGATGSAAQGIRVSGNSVGNILVPTLAGFLSTLAWNYPFFLYAASFPVLIAVYLFLPETGRTRDESHRSLGEALCGYFRSIRAQLRRGELSVLVSGGFARDFTRYALLTFIPIFAVQTLDASSLQAGLVLSMRGVMGVVVAPLSGLITAKSSPKRAILVSLAISGVALGYIPFVSDVLSLGAVVAVYSIGDTLFSPVLKDTVTSRTGSEVRGGVVSGMNMMKYSAQSLAPVVFGAVLAVSGFEALFLGAMAVLIAYGVAVSLFVE